jgi:putative transposase
MEEEIRGDGSQRSQEAKALEDENSRLKRLVADQAVQIHILKEVNAKKW